METMEKAQAFAHRIVEFADYEKCVKYLTDRKIDFDLPNRMGWSLLMSVCACGRDDLVGFVVDRSTALDCVTNTNRTTVLHLTAMSKNILVMEELVATPERKHKLQKILDQTNSHGDTGGPLEFCLKCAMCKKEIDVVCETFNAALMMACVAKNLRAVQLLLELGASMNAANASGLNALMCAARVGNDPRPGAPSIDEMMEQSALIVKYLLANEADVNAVEKARGNTALHIAVLSKNPIAVESLVSNARDLDITLRNEAGDTALDLSKRTFTPPAVSMQIKYILSKEWVRYETEAARMSAKVEQELINLAATEARDALDRTKTTKKKTGKKTNRKKKKAQPAENIPKESSGGTSTTQEPDDQTVEKMMNVSSVLDPTNAEARLELKSIATHQTKLEIDDCRFEDDDGPWQSVTPKNRRKELSSVNAEAPPKRKAISSQCKLFANDTTAMKPQLRSKSGTAPFHAASSGHMKAVVPTASARDVLLASQPSSRLTKGSTSAPEHSRVVVTEDTDRATRSEISYDMMNGSFHRTFPVAAELEIDVEKFLIASSMSDRELEPDNSLSISQVEVLQESHWQAYHYLNEKKIELTRILEAQRVEAQFDLQQELMRFK